ncbi:hypothetical protein [Novacetimonas pomaceti]|uniref:hypothetical protein n=1 Tax=Novacetimonas pomaceti TaxID=2021998 RepID=UPI001057A7C8|nr:hypothetical protein [Novacetimonas pomaceti]
MSAGRATSVSSGTGLFENNPFVKSFWMLPYFKKSSILCCCFKEPSEKAGPVIQGNHKKFLVKLFLKSFERHHLLKKGDTQKLLLFFIGRLFSNSLVRLWKGPEKKNAIPIRGEIPERIWRSYWILRNSQGVLAISLRSFATCSGVAA